ncbi:MAG: LysE family transporter [Acidobacteriia bacterium]|nr:LysE family transporter [Terriglobia bacterium]
MESIVFLKGLIIGFAMAVPIGPAAIMCIRKTLAEGHSRGLIVGLGAATADSLYGSIAAFGLTFVSDVIASQQNWLRLVGGGLLLFLGIRTFRVKPKDPILRFDRKGLLGAYVSALLLAFTNPVTFFAFVAVFAAFGLGYRLTIITACILVLGVLLGSCLWFLTLGYVATFFRKKLDSGGFRWVTRISGVLIILSGVAAFVSLI